MVAQGGTHSELVLLLSRVLVPTAVPVPIPMQMSMELEARQGASKRLQSQVHEQAKQQQQQLLGGGKEAVSALKAQRDKLLAQARACEERAERLQGELSGLEERCGQCDAALAVARETAAVRAEGEAAARGAVTEATELCRQLQGELAAVGEQVQVMEELSPGGEGHREEEERCHDDEDVAPPLQQQEGGRGKARGLNRGANSSSSSDGDGVAMCSSASSDSDSGEAAVAEGSSGRGGLRRGKHVTIPKSRVRPERGSRGSSGAAIEPRSGASMPMGRRCSSRRCQPEGKRRHRRGAASRGRGRSSSGEDDAGEDGGAEEGGAEEEAHRHRRRKLSPKEEEAESAWVAREGAAVDARQGELDALRQAIDATALKVGAKPPGWRERVQLLRPD